MHTYARVHTQTYTYAMYKGERRSVRAK